MNDQSVYGTTNFLVPAAGQTHCVSVNGAPFTASPFPVDWRNFKVDNFPFQPQGVIIDNSKGTGAITVNILPINFPVVCPAGGVLQTPFPAPNGQTATIVGTGVAGDIVNVHFVDYPVLPFYFNATSGASGTQNVSIVSIPTADIMEVDVAAIPPGSAYGMQQTPGTTHAYHGSIAAAATTNTIAPANNTTLMKLVLSVSGDASLAVAGDVTISCVLNGNAILTKTLSLNAAGGAFILGGYDFEIDTSMFGLLMGGSGTGLVTTLSAALSVGTVDVNAYFMHEYNISYPA